LNVRLDRANQHETITENRAIAHVNRERIGRVSASLAAHPRLKVEIA